MELTYLRIYQMKIHAKIVMSCLMLFLISIICCNGVFAELGYDNINLPQLQAPAL